jgi:hypothetical protein
MVQINLPGRRGPRIKMAVETLGAHVAELADALDSGFHYCWFLWFSTAFIHFHKMIVIVT